MEEEKKEAKKLFGGRLNYNTTEKICEKLGKWADDKDNNLSEPVKMRTGVGVGLAVGVGETAVNIVKFPFSAIGAYYDF